MRRISLLNFKNYEELTLHFSPHINCIVGDNGSGKTNLLDAIHYLSMSKSAFNTIDNQNIRYQEIYFTIQGDFQLEEENKQVFCGVQQGQKKKFKLDQQQYERISEHIGRFPVVMITPNDIDIIQEGSEVRRKFFDSIISQLNQTYLQNLIKYNRILKQRNSLLKQFYERNFFDKDLLASYDKGIIGIGKEIALQRMSFIREFQPVFQRHYQHIAGTQEQVDLKYQSDFIDEGFEQNFYNNLQKDVSLQRTTQGIHRDNFLFTIHKYPLKKYGSQGQQKSFIISLKIAHFQIISIYKKIKPILLLDDIFDKLDEKRMSKLIQMVAENTFGQIFVTDARPERTQKVFEGVQVEQKIIKINQGIVVSD